MKNSAKNVLTVTIAVVIILTVISSVFSYFAMANDFDHEICHFEKGSVNAAVAIIMPIAAALVSACCALFIRKKISLQTSPVIGIPTVFTSVLVGLLMLVSAVFTVIGDGELPKLSIGASIAAVFSCVYFLLLPFTEGKTFMTFFSFAPATWAAMKLLEEYFRTGEPINSPIRSINLTMFAFLLLFFSEEIRFRIGRQFAGVYYFCALSALAFTGVAVFPKLAIILTGTAGFDFDFIDWCLGAVVFLFIIARLSSLPPVLCNYVSPAEKAPKTSVPAETEGEMEEEKEESVNEEVHVSEEDDSASIDEKDSDGDE